MNVSKYQIECSFAKAQKKFTSFNQKKDNGSFYLAMDQANKRKQEETKQEEWIPIRDFITHTNTSTRQYRESVKLQDSLLRLDVQNRNSESRGPASPKPNQQKLRRQSQISEIRQKPKKMVNKQLRTSLDNNALNDSSQQMLDVSQISELDESKIEKLSPFKKVEPTNEELVDQSLHTETSGESINQEEEKKISNQRKQTNQSQKQQNVSRQYKIQVLADENQKELRVKQATEEQKNNIMDNKRNSILNKPKKKAFEKY